MDQIPEKEEVKEEIKNIGQIETLQRQKCSIIDEATLIDLASKSLEINLEEINELFEKFSSIIENHSFLESQNRYFSAYFETLTHFIGISNQKVQQNFDTKLNENKIKIDGTKNEKTDLIKEFKKKKIEFNEYQIENKNSLQDHFADQKFIDQLITRLSDLEFAIIFHKHRISEKEKINFKLKNDNLRLQTQLRKIYVLQQKEIENCNIFINQFQIILKDGKKEKIANENEIYKINLRIKKETNGLSQEYCGNDPSLEIKKIRAQQQQQNQNSICQSNNSKYLFKIQEFENPSSISKMIDKSQKQETKSLRKEFNELKNKVADEELKNILLVKQIEELYFQKENSEKRNKEVINGTDKLIAQTAEERNKIKCELENLINRKKTIDEEIKIYRKSLKSAE